MTKLFNYFHLVKYFHIFTGTGNSEDLVEAEESEAVAELVDRNHANRVSQISSSGSSGSSSNSSSTIICLCGYGAL